MTEAEPRERLQWHDVRDLGIEGKGWEDTDGDFERLPARA